MNQDTIGGYWPTYEDGTPVRIGDTVEGTFDPMTVECVTVHSNTTTVWSTPDGGGTRDHLHLSPGERVKRVGEAPEFAPCLCRDPDGGVETLCIPSDEPNWHLVIDGVRYGVSNHGRNVIAKALALTTSRQTLPPGIAWPEVDGEPVLPGDVLWDELGIRNEVMDVMFTTGFMSGSVGMADGGLWVSMDVLTRTEPKPVLDRDGVPIEVGDTVYRDDGSAYTVNRLLRGKRFNVRTFSETGNVYEIRAEDLTHQRPDSWERLTEDARKWSLDYWSCRDIKCCDCPSLVGGRTPRQRYGVVDCHYAMAADVVARAKAIAGVTDDE